MILSTLRHLLRPRPRPVAAPPVAPWPSEALGESFPAYRRTFAYAGAWIDESHRAISLLPVDGGLIRGPVQGFLRPADALALYELAYFASGPVLEMGSAWGLSTTILCRAVHNSGRRARVESIEIDPGFQQATAQAIAAQGLGRVYRPLPGDASVEAARLVERGRTFGFAFIDHDHTYEATRTACRHLCSLIEPGGLVLFHDFNDHRNRLEPQTYGVHRGVVELMDGPSWEFLGVIGCCALVRRHTQ